MPDEELSRLATAGKLRQNLNQQVARMLKDEKASAFAKNFVGQWLRARAIDTIQINSGAVLGREPRVIDPDADVRRRRFFELFRKSKNRTADEEAEYQQELIAFQRSFRGGPKFALTADLRRAMRRETELLFEHIVNEDRSLLELVDSDYTFLNEPLWGHYQIEGIDPVVGDEMRLVKLPPNSLRGGVLTQGTVLAVTSNPDRTSPVKRGLFILENLLGTPPAAPPPNIPALEDIEADEEESSRSAKRWRSIENTNYAVLATTAWTRLAWHWKTSTRWADIGRWSLNIRLTPRVFYRQVSRFPQLVFEEDTRLAAGTRHLPLPDRKADDLRVRAGGRIHRYPHCRRSRGEARGQRRQSLDAYLWYHSFQCLPAHSEGKSTWSLSMNGRSSRRNFLRVSGLASLCRRWNRYGLPGHSQRKRQLEKHSPQPRQAHRCEPLSCSFPMEPSRKLGGPRKPERTTRSARRSSLLKTYATSFKY